MVLDGAMYSAPETQTDSVSQMPKALQACSRERSSDLCIGLLVSNLGIFGRVQLEVVQADTVRVLWGKYEMDLASCTFESFRGHHVHLASGSRRQAGDMEIELW